MNLRSVSFELTIVPLTSLFCFIRLGRPDDGILSIVLRDEDATDEVVEKERVKEKLKELFEMSMNYSTSNKYQESISELLKETPEPPENQAPFVAPPLPFVRRVTPRALLAQQKAMQMAQQKAVQMAEEKATAAKVAKAVDKTKEKTDREIEKKKVIDAKKVEKMKLEEKLKADNAKARAKLNADNAKAAEKERERCKAFEKEKEKEKEKATKEAAESARKQNSDSAMMRRMDTLEKQLQVKNMENQRLRDENRLRNEKSIPTASLEDSVLLNYESSMQKRKFEENGGAGGGHSSRSRTSSCESCLHYPSFPCPMLSRPMLT